MTVEALCASSFAWIIAAPFCCSDCSAWRISARRASRSDDCSSMVLIFSASLEGESFGLVGDSAGLHGEAGMIVSSRLPNSNTLMHSLE